jgi:hypothetical protein
LSHEQADVGTQPSWVDTMLESLSLFIFPKSGNLLNLSATLGGADEHFLLDFLEHHW